MVSRLIPNSSASYNFDSPDSARLLSLARPASGSV